MQNMLSRERQTYRRSEGLGRRNAPYLTLDIEFYRKMSYLRVFCGVVTLRKRFLNLALVNMSLAATCSSLKLPKSSISSFSGQLYLMPILKLQRFSLPTCFIHLGPILQQGVRHENDQIQKEKNLIFLEKLMYV